MLQVEHDASFLFLVADSSNAPTDKTTATSAPFHHPSENSPMSANHWQPPSWHHHHTRHMPPPSNAAAHLPSTFLPSSANHSRSATSSPTHDEHSHGHNDPRYGASYGYTHSYDEAPRDNYYAPESHWSYPATSHAQHHQQQSYAKSESMGMGIDPLPLRQLGVPSTGPGDDELYEAHMLQEALTTPQYTRSHLGGFHHPHQLPTHVQVPQHQQHHSVPAPPYSSPFVSAVLDASVPMHHHSHSPSPALGGVHMARQTSSTPSEYTARSDSDATSSDLKSSTAGKRKRRGDSAPRLCRVEGCTKGIRSRGLCKAHGGGRRCMTPGCTTSDQGGGHCVLHGGGRRCTIEGCTKSAQWKGLCKMHGGARRCRYQNCTKNGQVKAGYCRAHHNLITKQREQGLVEA